MKILVTGGAGFIGSNLIDALLREGHEISCIDNLSNGKKENIKHLENNKDFSFYEADICVEGALESIIEKDSIEYIFHLAANSDIKASAENPFVEYENTLSTTYYVLEAMRLHKIKKLFFASTSAVYGDKENIFLDEETTDLSPVSYYGAAKLGSEALIKAYSFMNNMQSLVFRFPNVIGPRLTHGVIYDFIDKLTKNPSQLEILGDGSQTKPYMYVDDLVSAILCFMNTEKDGVTLYNVGVDTETSVSKIADIVCEEMNLRNVKYQYKGGKVGWKGDVSRFRYCLDKIHNTGWRAQYTSDEAVRLAIRNNR